MGIIVALRQRRGFTATDEAIADYVLDHLGEAIGMNAAELARASHSSKSAVTRLCHRLGFDGYRAFLVELAREVERTYAFGVNLNRPFNEWGNPNEIVDAIATLQSRAVNDARSLINTADVYKAARLILRAPHVLLYGIDDSVSSIDLFSGLLLKSGIPSISGHALNDLYSLGAITLKEDVSVIVSYSGRLLRHLEERFLNVPYVRNNTIVITSDSSVKGYMQGDDVFIQLPPYENPAESIAPFYSQACVHYALMCIYGAVLANTWETSNAVHLGLVRAGITSD